QALTSTIVLRTVVGSHAWGLADETSDVDHRGVFLLPFPWRQGLVRPPQTLIAAGGSDVYWELDKCIEQALRADPNTLETLFLSSAEPLDELGAQLLALRDAFASRRIYGSFGRYALSQLKKLQQSQRLADDRHHILGWLRDTPALTLDQLAERLVVSAAIEGASPSDRHHRAKAYIKQLYGSLHDQGLLPRRDLAALAQLAQSDHAFEPPRTLRPKNAYNLLRLLATATTWLRDGTPTFAFAGPLRDRLRAVKRGEVPLDQVMAEAQAMVPALEAAHATSPLPDAPNYPRIDQTLRDLRTEAARRYFAKDPGPFGRDCPPLPLLVSPHLGA
ncbi:MAG: nucleotidyltransferase domain-containing protein, partial [Myxococcales bacterium]|nr:nucleotidyltransferase domain-containing protein [Myxococcales bacterium]